MFTEEEKAIYERDRYKVAQERRDEEMRKKTEASERIIQGKK
jgi:hypothetical protein